MATVQVRYIVNDVDVGNGVLLQATRLSASHASVSCFRHALPGGDLRLVLSKPGVGGEAAKPCPTAVTRAGRMESFASKFPI